MFEPVGCVWTFENWITACNDEDDREGLVKGQKLKLRFMLMVARIGLVATKKGILNLYI